MGRYVCAIVVELLRLTSAKNTLLSLVIQGFLSFGIFGLDRHLIILPFKKRY